MSKKFKLWLLVALLVLGVGTYVLQEQKEQTAQTAQTEQITVTEEELSQEMGPVMRSGKAPDPKVMVDLFGKYKSIKSGQSMETLVMATTISYSAAGRMDEGIVFAEQILADNSFAAAVRQSSGVAKAFAIANQGDMAKAEKVLDEAIAILPDSQAAQSRDFYLQQMKKEAGKR